MFQFDFTTVFITNLIGIINTACVYGTNRCWLKTRSRERRYLIYMMLITVISGIVDPITYAVDGREGSLFRRISYIGNTWLYLSYVLISITGIFFTLEHLHIRRRRPWKIFCIVMLLLGVDLLTMNFEVPLAFRISESNRFSRTSLSGLFFGLICLTILLGNAIYLRVRQMNGFVRFFPLWLLAMPLLIGTAIQYRCYGISIIWPCESISVAIMVGCMKNEALYQDQLTGLYSRYFLDYLWDHLRLREGEQLSYIRVHLSGLGNINRQCGHSIGDQAIVEGAELLKRAVDEKGTIIRYEGTVCLIFLPSSVDTDGCMEQISERFADYNREHTRLFHLDITMRSGACDIRHMKLNEFLDEIETKE